MIFQDRGMEIFSNVLDVSAWQEDIAAHLAKGRVINPFNPVECYDLPCDFASNEKLIDLATTIFGLNIGLYRQRLLVKDKDSYGAVPLHHDSPYHTGFPSKASCFVAISPSGPDNGGLIFYPGTHKLGLLGDAGQINPDLLEGYEAVCPTLKPGDVVMMDSLLWHRSGAHTHGPDRILVDIIYQNANDPSTTAVLRGKRSGKLLPTDKPLFVSSRVSRLQELQMKLGAK